MTYAWRDGSRLGHLDAQVVGERLAHLEAVHGHLTARIVVDDARTQDSPLHPAFEWDDTKAAELYREEQARHILRSIVVVDAAPTQVRPVHAYVVVRDDKHGQAYRSTVHVMQDDGLRKQVLRRAWDELQSWRRRYQDLAEFAQVMAAIDQMQMLA